MFKFRTDTAEGVSDLYLSVNYRQRSYLKYNHADTIAFVRRCKLTLQDFLELVMKHSFLLPLKLNKLAFHIRHLNVTMRPKFLSVVPLYQISHL